MSDCCVEEGMLQALRGLECTPIPANQHFVGIRRGEECLPYLVVRGALQAGLRTSDGVETLDQLFISAYFSPDKSSDAMRFRQLLHDWSHSSGCLDLGGCGCLCVRAIQPIVVAYTQKATSVTMSLNGRFAASVTSS